MKKNSPPIKTLDISAKNTNGFIVPKVHFDASTGVCELSGESSIENTLDFYGIMLSWLDSYMKNGNSIIFNFKLTYFNTSSSKGILELMKKLKNYMELGSDVKVNWYYDKDDETILEEGQDYIEYTNLPISLISYTN